MTEYELITQILSGNLSLYKQIVETYQAQVFRICIGFVHQKEDADDLTQEVFIQVYQSLETFKGESSFSTWLYRITINRALNHVRDHQKRSLFHRLESWVGFDKSSSGLEVQTFEENPEQQLIKHEERNLIAKALTQLPEKQRIAIVLSKYEDLSQREIAEILHISEGAVESLLQRAKQSLRKQLSALWHSS
ncbi:RNA polymerase sigma factor [Microbacter margulisiae]|uniref:RNA polymerase sigma factor n=1 Tax=Microbacter margulisiae TaxID=1350067 RepID=A0A7W5DNN0_9PORP|nr:RNA polymerase sigma factor [Microbacter margulisiae]MBB3186280.1 RNA polymerase sigma-70 factor (ECF subfamily) [Microbacter margulisiae]